MRAVWRGKRGGVTIDLVATQRAIAQGKLSDRDRATVDRVLPGFFGKDGQVVFVAASELRSDGQAGGLSHHE